MTSHLLINFYTELSSTFSEENNGNFVSVVSLNAEHPVYKGHFEQVPIAPGVCLTQMIKEILMDKFKMDLILSQGNNIKFLAMVNPNETQELTISFSVTQKENELEVSSNFTNGTTSYVKFKGMFKAVL